MNSYFCIDEAYIESAQLLLSEEASESAPRGMRVKELIDYAFRIENPYLRIVSVPARELSLRYLAGEFAFYLAGSNSLAFIGAYSKFWERVSDDGRSVNSAYGKRLFYDVYSARTQFEYVADTLVKDNDSRKAVMMIYRPEDSKDSRDNPCTLSLQFLIRKRRLHLIANMRSNDIWFGTPYDAAFFMFVQELMLSALRGRGVAVEMGTYTHHAASFHAYEKDWDGLAKVAKTTFVRHEKQSMPTVSPFFEQERGMFLMSEEYVREGADRKFRFADPVLTWLYDHLKGEAR